jgi:hypothetical protein
MDSSIYIDIDQMILIKLININVITTQVKADIDTMKTRRLTHEYIMNRPSSKSRLNAMIVALDFTSTRTEALSAITIKMWSILNSKTI